MSEAEIPASETADGGAEPRPAPAWTRGGYAYPALFLGSVIESAVVPWPIEFPLLAIMLRGRGHVFPAALVVTLGSAGGALIAYAAGVYAFDSVAHWVAEHPRWAEAVDAARAKAVARGGWAAFIGMMTPAPVQITSFASGAAGVGPWAFFAAALAGRGIRYGSMAVLIYAFGPRIMSWWRARSRRVRLGLIAAICVLFVIALVAALML
jgi:membrane protein YqaA with SNARE-associated domain